MPRQRTAEAQHAQTGGVPSREGGGEVLGGGVGVEAAAAENNGSEVLVSLRAGRLVDPALPKEARR